MQRKEIIEFLKNELRKKRVFASYKRFLLDHISDDELIENVLVHLDIENIKLLFTIYDESRIKFIWKKTMSKGSILDGLNNLYKKELFDTTPITNTKQKIYTGIWKNKYVNSRTSALKRAAKFDCPIVISASFGAERWLVEEYIDGRKIKLEKIEV